jgi:D-hexose-6-phosphate mutarotase
MIEDDGSVMLTFALQNSAETMKLWPHEFTLCARFKLGKTCEIELEAHGEFETTSACIQLLQRRRYRGGESERSWRALYR